ncbi:TVP38/TMEM64 family protein [Nakamurella antarctica]|uniref:TVP38/TMEM64 family membrane protein n=1 Tax=Nakamurella antarctica TaxID=1902245 RepID=A0A3G8ZLZ7_9ACTN|nr:TVP38/TMEM64 family protein [Nakamurella antarctica]AZI58369.1 TVP38/TMEM64 family protein [Nakamurella antarctica]
MSAPEPVVEPCAAAPMSRSLRWQLIGIAAVAIIVITVTVTVGLPDLAQLRNTFAQYPRWIAAPIFAGVYAVATLSPLPKTVFSLAAGALFGLPLGLLAVWVGTNLGAVAAFAIGRALGKDGLHRVLGKRAKTMDKYLERKGFATILAARLIPIVPFTVVNYASGAASIALPGFVAATALGVLPASTAYVSVGAFGVNPNSWQFWSAVGALTALTVAGWIAVVMRRRSAARRAAEVTEL